MIKAVDTKTSKPAKIARDHSSMNDSRKEHHGYTFLLQRTIGNQLLQRLLRSQTGVDFQKIRIQPKLRVSQPDDASEQEADRLAEQIAQLAVRDSVTLKEAIKQEDINLECIACEAKNKEENDKLRISRRVSTLPELEVRDEMSNEINNVLSNNGTSLDTNTKEFMESRFDYDFGSVRIHTDEMAARSANLINASAYTVGNDIVFGEWRYQPNTIDGRRLLAHELTHVVQQGSNFSRTIAQRDPVDIASLGVAIISYGHALVFGGNFSSTMVPVSYMHENTPLDQQWYRVRSEILINAWNPRIWGGWEHFYFDFSYETNGNDLRNIQIVPLKDKSSAMISSAFQVTWSGDKYSPPNASIAEVIFQIAGEWNPVGLGLYSFRGQLIVSASKHWEWDISMAEGGNVEKGY